MRTLIVLLSAAICSTAAHADDALDAAKLRCGQYGFQQGTDKYASCVQGLTEKSLGGFASEEEQRKARNRCEAAMYTHPAAGGNIGAAMGLVARCKSDPQAHLKIQMPQSNSMHCARALGGGFNCESE